MIDKTQNPAEIYLVPVFDGDHDHVWCDTPAPGEGMREEDATRYVREDIYLALQAQVEQLREDLARCRHQASYSIGGVVALQEQLSKIRIISNTALAATPTQCLVEIKAQAVEDVGSTILCSFDFGAYNAKLGLVDDLDAEFRKLANQLRQQSNGGERCNLDNTGRL